MPSPRRRPLQSHSVVPAAALAERRRRGVLRAAQYLDSGGLPAPAAAALHHPADQKNRDDPSQTGLTRHVDRCSAALPSSLRHAGAGGFSHRQDQPDPGGRRRCPGAGSPSQAGCVGLGQLCRGAGQRAGAGVLGHQRPAVAAAQPLVVGQGGVAGADGGDVLAVYAAAGALGPSGSGNGSVAARRRRSEKRAPLADGAIACDGHHPLAGDADEPRFRLNRCADVSKPLFCFSACANVPSQTLDSALDGVAILQKCCSGTSRHNSRCRVPNWRLWP